MCLRREKERERKYNYYFDSDPNCLSECLILDNRSTDFLLMRWGFMHLFAVLIYCRRRRHRSIQFSINHLMYWKPILLFTSRANKNRLVLKWFQPTLEATKLCMFVVVVAVGMQATKSFHNDECICFSFYVLYFFKFVAISLQYNSKWEWNYSKNCLRQLGR